MQQDPNTPIATPTSVVVQTVDQPIAQPQVEDVTQNIDTNPPRTSTRIENILDGKLFGWIFTAGFSSIFLINSLNAALKPNDFIRLIAANPLSRAVGHYGIMTKLILVNDLIIGVLILTGWKKKYVWAWAGIWLLIVAGIKALYIF